jgi:hypothetical protein
MRKTPVLTVALTCFLAFMPPAAAQEGTAPDAAGAMALPPDLDDILAGQEAEAADALADVLAGSEVRQQVLDMAMGQVRFPATVLGPLREALDGLLQTPAPRMALAGEMRKQFDQFGIASPNAEQIARVAATMLPAWALDGVDAGLPRMQPADQRAVLATRLAIAESLSPDRCEAYLSDWATDGRVIEMSAIAAMPPDRAAAVLGLLMTASLAGYGQDAPAPAMDPADEDRARQTLGAAIMAAVDASPDPDKLIAALSPTAWGDPADTCTARRLVLRTALDLPAPEGDQALRLIAAFGLDGY